MVKIHNARDVRDTVLILGLISTLLPGETRTEELGRPQSIGWHRVEPRLKAAYTAVKGGGCVGSLSKLIRTTWSNKTYLGKREINKMGYTMTYLFQFQFTFVSQLFKPWTALSGSSVLHLSWSLFKFLSSESSDACN